MPDAYNAFKLLLKLLCQPPKINSMDYQEGQPIIVFRYLRTLCRFRAGIVE